MDRYRKLRDALKEAMPKQKVILWQGVVKNVDTTALTCTVTMEDMDLSDVRLRATTNVNDKQMLFVPTVGSIVIFGTLTGNLDELIVLAYDQIDTLVINGGDLGGLVKVNELKTQLAKMTTRIDGIITALKSGTVAAGDGGATLLASVKAELATITDKENFSEVEDTNVSH
jgi:hypothetical protein